MAKKLKILIFPDPRLRKVAKIITKFDKSLESLANDMLETMYIANGIGLAATQVDRHIRLIVMDLSEERDDPRILSIQHSKYLKIINYLSMKRVAFQFLALMKPLLVLIK